MKRLVAIFLTALLIFSVMPISVFAIEKNDRNFDRFLIEIGWEKQAYLDYLESKDWSLGDFEHMQELGTPMTEEAIQTLLADYNLTRDELNKILIEYGYIEQGQDVLEGTYLIFIDELEDFIEYRSGLTPISDENLQELAEYYDFGSVKEMEEFLNGFGDSVENYQSIEELEEAITIYLSFGEDAEFILDGLFTAFGLTEEELDKLGEHLGTLDYENPAFEAKLTELADRMMAIGEFETANDLTAEQFAEILSIFTELQALFNVTTQYFLITDDAKQEITLETLLTLDTTNGFDLLVEVYNLQGTFLADILLTADLFESEIIVDTGEDLKEVEDIVADVVAETPAKTPAKPKIHKDVKKPVVASTVKGGKLPKTAGDYIANTLAGLALVLIGIALFRRFKVTGV